MKKVLFVGSSTCPFLPANAHRIRHLSWDLEKLGWEICQLFPGPEFQSADWLDQNSRHLFKEIKNTFLVKPQWNWFFKTLKINSVCWKAFLPLANKGFEIIKKNNIDLVYISTTQFPLFVLGAYWKKRTGVNYILDYQDPWVKEKKLYNTTKNPWKEKVSETIGVFLEKIAIKNCLGLVSVSPKYVEMLRGRYPKTPLFEKENYLVLPFGFCESDFNPPSSLKDNNIHHDKVTKRKKLTICYVGVGSFIMRESFRAILINLKKIANISDNVQIMLYGTDGSWSPGKSKILEELAKEMGFMDLVIEDPTIIPYSKSINLLKESDGVIILGVEDPAYIPSKLFPYAFSGKPILACLHSNSHSLRYFNKYQDLGNVITFPETENNHSANKIALESYLDVLKKKKNFVRQDVKKDFSTYGVALEHHKFFIKCLK